MSTEAILVVLILVSAEVAAAFKLSSINIGKPRFGNRHS